MSETLQLSKYNSTFVDKIGSVPIEDLKKPLGKTFKVSEQCYKRKAEIASNLTSLGTKHVFTIPKTGGYVGSFGLIAEVNGIVSTKEDANWAFANFIQTVEVKLGTTTLMLYEGTDIPKMIHLANRGKTDIIQQLSQLQTMNEATITNQIIYTPLFAPGSNMRYGLDAFDQRQPAWPIGLCNTDMTIEITFRAAAVIFKVQAGTPTAFASAPRLTYNTYSVDETVNVGTQSLVSNKDSGSVWYSWTWVRPQYYETSFAVSASTEYSVQPDGIIDSGELDFLTFEVVDSTANLGTLFNYTSGSSIKSINVTAGGGAEIFKFDECVEGKARTMEAMKCAPILYNTVARTRGTGAFYMIPMTDRPDLGGISGNIGSKGLVLVNNKPTIKFVIDQAYDGAVKFNSTDTAKIRVTAYYKCMYNIMKDGTVKTRYDPKL